MTQSPIQFFFEGDEFFNSLWQDLHSAQTEIAIEVYRVDEDEIGKRLKDALVQKSLAGVSVKIVFDSIGSRLLSNIYLDELRSAGVRLKMFHPLLFFSPWKSPLNKRNHRKTVMIDQTIGYLGGINFFRFASKQFYGNQCWRDTQIRVTGPMVAKMLYHFRRTFRELWFYSRKMERITAQDDVVGTRNFLGRNPIRRYIHRYVRRSRHRICISSGYFIPDIEMIYLLLRAKKRGVRVQIITNSDQNLDVPQVNRVNRPILRFLVKRGIEIYFFNNRMMHAKSALFDDKVATVGSANFNYRSFFRDYELNVFLRKPHSIKMLQQQFNQDLKDSRAVTFEELDNISLFTKLVDGLFYLIRSFF